MIVFVKIDDFIQEKYQWVSDLVFTYRDDISPWILAKHCCIGGIVLYNLYHMMHYFGFISGFILSMSIPFTAGMIRSCSRKHTRWLAGKENPPERTLFVKLLWVSLTILAITDFVKSDILTIASFLITSSLYFHSCSSPTNLEIRKPVYAGI